MPGTPPQGWINPRTNWTSSDVILPGDLNRIEGNALAIETGNRTIDPASVPSSNTGSLRQFLDWFANRLRSIIGTEWYNNPPITLEQDGRAYNHRLSVTGIHGLPNDVRPIGNWSNLPRLALAKGSFSVLSSGVYTWTLNWDAAVSSISYLKVSCWTDSISAEALLLSVATSINTVDVVVSVSGASTVTVHVIGFGT